MADPERSTSVAERFEQELSDYRAISVLALLGLVLGLVSVLAFSHPALWCLPLSAVVVSVLALRRIRDHQPRLAGRGLALAGLSLSLVSLVGAPTNHFVLQARNRAEARECVRIWLNSLAQHRPEMAAELMLETYVRQLPDEDLVAYYRDEPAALRTLRDVLSGTVAKAVYALGPRAELHYLETWMQRDTPFKERIKNLWAVTYEEDGERKSFLALFSLERSTRVPRHVDQWKISKVEFVRVPQSAEEFVE